MCGNIPTAACDGKFSDLWHYFGFSSQMQRGSATWVGNPTSDAVYCSGCEQLPMILHFIGRQ
jgi:hypothetical protein